jgi:hypothetical protein
MTDVSFYVDPSCPWAWVASRWLVDVAASRDLAITWKSYCIEIRDEYDLAPGFPAERRALGLAAHAISHRMLRVFEATRAELGESAVDRLYSEWGPLFFSASHDALLDGAGSLIEDCLDACQLSSALAEAQHEEKWDGPIAASMEVAYAFGGNRTQTPTIVIETDPPHGFKGPVMSHAPTGDSALRLWDALLVVSEHPGFFELARPRTSFPSP